jgi:hypothetical protein
MALITTMTVALLSFVPQLNTLAVRRAFVYAMGQTLQVPEHDIIILTQLQVTDFADV